jgi:multimeric flavodoxin WrbA
MESIMEVLVINSSPRKAGNSDILCDQFIKGATESGNEVEKINLREQKISPCSSCYACLKTKACVNKDDMEEILQKLIKADVIVLATPIYFYSMSAQLKMMIDRCLPRYTEIENKEFYYILTAADSQESTAEETIIGLRGFLRSLPNAKEKGLVLGLGTYEKGDVYNHPAFERAYKLGKAVGN